MFRLLTKVSFAACLALSLQSAVAFSLLGPNNEAWQVPDIGYNPLPTDTLPTAPKNLGEEYRRNTPFMYYTFDANFIDYFGVEGMAAVEQAFAVYNGLTNVSSYSRELSEFPNAVTRENYRASALSLFDIKSYTMYLLAEQLGLASPERYVWTLHTRYQTPGTTWPDGMQYLVVKRNFDPVPTPLDQFQSSSYVNGTLYSYVILDDNQAPPPLADAAEFPVDPLDIAFTSVANDGINYFASGSSGRIFEGKYFMGLTRDDVGGLRYLYRAGNMNWESTGPDTISLITNQTPELLYTSNLTTFAAQALTNSAAALQALYPGLVITSTSNSFSTVWVTNTIPYFTNSPFDPAYSVPRLAFATNRTLAIQNNFYHTFENLWTVFYTNNAWSSVPITNLTSLTNVGWSTLFTTEVNASQTPFAPVGSFTLTTNVLFRNFVTNRVSGEFFILPTNACEAVILGSQLTITNVESTIISSVTNTIVISNAVTVTNITQEFTQEIVDFPVTHAFLILPVSCIQSNVVLAGGVERIQFIRRDYDSLLGRFFEPITNNYTIPVLTNNTVQQMRVYRPVTAPDILITATDLSPGPGAEPTDFYVSRPITFSTNGLAFYPGLAGPGTIEGPTSFTYNKAGPVWFNSSPNAFFWWQAEASHTPIMIWGSFDGSTNAPVVFPNGETLQNVENHLLIQVSPGALPEGRVGIAFTNTTFSVMGGTAPFTYSLAPNSAGLPPGLTLSPSGTISGTPTLRATYDFVVRVSDAAGRSVDRPYSIKINW